MAYSWMTTAGSAKLHLGSYEQAVTWFRRAIAWTAQSDDPTYLAQLEPIFDGLRKAGVPEE